MRQEKKGSLLRDKASPASGTNASRQPKPAAPVEVQPLFRKVDWAAFWAATVLVLIGYLLTLAPDLTLEDSGELAVGSYYAGVPHPPGYPVWTIITWLFTVLIPISNIAWRVALSSAVAGAFACGLLALVVSRGSSMMIESIPMLRNIERALENRLCLVAGLVGGLLLGFNGYMWSQAVIVEVYTMSVLSLMLVIVFLLRWLYAPHQRRFLYLAFFFFGICLTNHMSLLVAAMGIQVAVAAVNPRIGRDLFAGNTIIWLATLALMAAGVVEVFQPLEEKTAMFVIFCTIGFASAVGCLGLTLKTGGVEYSKGGFGSEWRKVILMGLAWLLGASFYFYMPIASMTNPPMNWGYPRTAEGFMHAIQRGQYETVRPTDNPVVFARQVGMYVEGAMEEFTMVYLLIGLLPFVFYRFMKRRERAWLIGLAAIYMFLAFLLLILLNPGLDRQSRELHKVFFTASHVIIAIGIGYGVALIGAYLLTQYENGRRWVLGGAAAATGLGLFTLVSAIETTYGDIEGLSGGRFFYGLRATLLEGQNFWPVTSGLLLFALTAAFLVLILVCRQRIHLGAVLTIFALMPLPMIMLHWEENGQRGHRFGYWFGHDMFTPPFDVYPEMAQDAILFGGTDPGRFNPTYMIFCESFIAPQKRYNPEFDRRDVYIITQNALADGTYLSYIRAHYNRSTQVDPPFFQEFFQTGLRPVDWVLGPPLSLLDNIFTSIGDRVEKRRRVGTSYFGSGDFLDITTLAGRLQERSDALSNHLYDELSDRTREQFSGSERALRRALQRDLNRILEGGSLYSPERFEGIEISERTNRFIAQDPQGHTRIRLNRLLLEEAYAEEIAKSPGGVYPDLEIHTPSVGDSEAAFHAYLRDAERRYRANQLKPGENLRIGEDGRVQVSGQVAVMGINALLTRVIFDRNPDHEFYLEESFPLDWMYPYLTPHGIIMRINREPVPELTPEILARDHEFWSRYSERLIGNWITYDTTVAEIAEFAERVYLRRDYRNFEGDRRFIRDDNAQKAFSKLRSSIGGIYAWRLGADCPQDYQQKSPESQELLLRETEFALKQALAFCPYSPEAVHRYVLLLVSMNRLDDALLVVKTALKFDPLNGALRSLYAQLENIRMSGGGIDFQAAFNAAAVHMNQGRRDQALQLFDQILASPQADATTVISVAQAYIQMNEPLRLEQALLRLVQVAPENPEAWYDLAATQAGLGRNQEALKHLRRAIELSQTRLRTDPGRRNLITEARQDPRFADIQHTAEFQRLMRGR